MKKIIDTLDSCCSGRNNHADEETMIEKRMINRKIDLTKVNSHLLNTNADMLPRYYVWKLLSAII